MSKELIRLFKAVEIESNKKKNPSKELLKETVKRGFVFAPEVVYNYTEAELNTFIKVIEKEVGLSAEKMNSSFHKSWGKVKNAPIEQLVLEQIIHYMTTYGFENVGIYNEDSVYIPNEKLEIPELKEGIKLVVIHGYTKEEIKDKLLSLIIFGIALATDTIKDVVKLIDYVGIKEIEISSVKNKEIKIALYDHFNVVPSDPIEFLRYAVYKSIGKTLLIKDPVTITEIKSEDNKDIARIFNKYDQKHGLENLAKIFYRFKPLFLAFRTNKPMKKITNRIRKLAPKYHVPMTPDYLNSITAMIKNGEFIDVNKFRDELSKVNIFRKIRLAYALKFRTHDVDSIVYRIRNGKSYATDFKFNKKDAARNVLKTVMDSIVEDINKNVKGKKIYIPDYINYTLPYTEKMFTGDLPSGTCVVVPKDIVFGVHWENVNGNRVDIDLSIINADGDKYGWDGYYRIEDKDILFSGDVTDAPLPNGASELFYVKRQSKSSHILLANYYNMSDGGGEVPLKIMVGKEEVKGFKNNYMINPNNVISIAKTKISQKQKVLGLLVTTTEECRFYFAEAYLGNSITSFGKDYVENSRKFLFDFYENAISLSDVLEKAGCKLVKDKNKCDIDLSPESLEKNKIINLIK